MVNLKPMPQRVVYLQRASVSERGYCSGQVGESAPWDLEAVQLGEEVSISRLTLRSIEREELVWRVKSSQSLLVLLSCWCFYQLGMGFSWG